MVRRDVDVSPREQGRHSPQVCACLRAGRWGLQQERMTRMMKELWPENAGQQCTRRAAPMPVSLS
eukprot:1622988-Rhodomonas_salina.2